MKKRPLTLLTAITCVFLAFTAGFFLGRNQNHESVRLSVLPAEARHGGIPPSLPQEETIAAAISFPIDINSAGIQELTALPGIGETLAQRILDYRQANGSFARPEELLNVEGIGSGKLEALLDYVMTGG